MDGSQNMRRNTLAELGTEIVELASKITFPTLISHLILEICLLQKLRFES